MHWIDPDRLPEITGTLDQFLVNKHGEADGFLLTDGGEVHVPPHLSSRLVRDLRPGSQVSRPLKGEAPTIDLVLGYNKANTSPILKLLLSRMDELTAQISSKARRMSEPGSAAAKR
jgi:hypothetical protein